MSITAASAEAITAAADQIVTAEREPRRGGTSVRLPDDLLDWYEAYGERFGVKRHRALVIGLEAFRAAVEARPAIGRQGVRNAEIEDQRAGRAR